MSQHGFLNSSPDSSTNADWLTFLIRHPRETTHLPVANFAKVARAFGLFEQLLQGLEKLCAYDGLLRLGFSGVLRSATPGSD
jgi:hypothetical protein